jgi:hypothetical protein
MQAMRIVPVLVVVLALVGCGGADRSDDAAPARPAPDAAPARPAPEVTGMTLDGEAFALGDLRGKPVMLNAWASW